MKEKALLPLTFSMALSPFRITTQQQCLPHCLPSRSAPTSRFPILALSSQSRGICQGFLKQMKMRNARFKTDTHCSESPCQHQAYWDAASFRLPKGVRLDISLRLLPKAPPPLPKDSLWASAGYSHLFTSQTGGAKVAQHVQIDGLDSTAGDTGSSRMPRGRSLLRDSL